MLVNRAFPPFILLTQALMMVNVARYVPVYFTRAPDVFIPRFILVFTSKHVIHYVNLSAEAQSNVCAAAAVII